MTRSFLFFACALIVFAAPASGQEASGSQELPTGWHLAGSTELAMERYVVTGDKSASPYRFDGTFWTERLRLGLGYDGGPFRRFDILFEGRAADNDYLANEGAVLETLRLDFQNGASALPYHLSGGDVFADFSQRTLQRQIKGASFEIQPQAARFDHSLVFVAGSGRPAWEDLGDDLADDLLFAGASYLLASRSGRYSLVANVVDVTERPSAARTALPMDRSHQVGSLFGEAAVGRVRLEGEVAVLARDEPLASTDQRDQSFYGQASQTRGSLSWKLRFEDNGQGYLTPGANGILADRRIGEAHVRWAPRGVGEVRVRIQDIASDVNGVQPELNTGAYGASYAGIVARRRPSMRVRIDADLNNLDAEDGSRDQRFGNYRLALEDRLASGAEWSYEGKLRRLDDRLDRRRDRDTTEHALRAGYRWTRGEADSPVRLGLTGGLVLRQQGKSAEFDSWSPLVDFSLGSRYHRVGLHLSFLKQDFAVLTTSDLEYLTQRITWAWERGRHLVNLDLGQERRLPDGREGTTSIRAALSYRLSFDRVW